MVPGGGIAFVSFRVYSRGCVRTIKQAYDVVSGSSSIRKKRERSTVTDLLVASTILTKRKQVDCSFLVFFSMKFLTN